MKYIALILSVIAFSCKKETITPSTPTPNLCTTASLEVVNTNVYNKEKIYINGTYTGTPIQHYQEVTFDTLRIGVSYSIEAIDLTNNNSQYYTVTLTNADCGGTAVQDVSP